jgi:hypothetical protein
MSSKRFAAFVTSAASAICFLANVARADTINFGQYQPDQAVYGNVVTGTTADGIGFTLTGNGYGFTRETANTTDWVDSQFPSGTPILYDGNLGVNGPGPVTIVFSAPISSITGISAESNNFGNYTATLTAYDGATVLGTSSYWAAGLTTSLPGTLPSFSFSSPGITSISIDTSTDGTGFVIGSNPVPEPATWAMLLLGLFALGAALRHSRRATFA